MQYFFRTTQVFLSVELLNQDYNWQYQDKISDLWWVAEEKQEKW